MQPEKLVKMANQIGAFFEAMPDQELAARDVATHIMHSWAPRMRQALLLHLASIGDGQLKYVVRMAVPHIQP